MSLTINGLHETGHVALEASVYCQFRLLRSRYLRVVKDCAVRGISMPLQILQQQHAVDQSHIGLVYLVHRRFRGSTRAWLYCIVNADFAAFLRVV